MYTDKRNKRDAVSPVIAVILMVAITVVLAAVLFVMVQQYVQEGENVTTPLGATAGAPNDDYWVININAGEASVTDLRLQLQYGGAAYNDTSTVYAADARWTVEDGASANVPSNTTRTIIWLDNNDNSAIDTGDSIRIYKRDMPSGSYDLLIMQQDSTLVNFRLIKA